MTLSLIHIYIKNVVVGRILSIEKHPDADHLVICSVDVAGEAPLQIVTGADNVFEGAVVPVALSGAELPNGMKIKTGKLRGVRSEGMLCSGEELCLTEADVPGASVNGILILNSGLTIGAVSYTHLVQPSGELSGAGVAGEVCLWRAGSSR